PDQPYGDDGGDGDARLEHREPDATSSNRDREWSDRPGPAAGGVRVMRAKYVLSEAATGLWRNVTMTIAMIITLTVSLTMLGASGLLFMQVGKVRELYYAQVEVSIFLSEDITDEQR